MDPDEVRDKLKFAEELGQLKHIDRRGWILRQVPFPERIAVSLFTTCHSFEISSE